MKKPRKPHLIRRPWNRKAKCPAKKPRTLNAVWGDAQCLENGFERGVHLWVDTRRAGLTAKQALRLSQWLAEAAAWKAEE